MILFIISFLLVFLCAYFITCVLVDDRPVNGIFYFLLTAFANVVLTMEILSLFSAIYIPGVLVLNVIFLLISVIVWVKRGKPLWKLPLKNFLKKYFICIKQDKYLALLSVGLFVAVSTALFMSSFMPIMNFDAESYHALRSLFWVHNHNLNHFYISDMRNIAFPINSELVYAWVFMFIKRSAWIMYTSFAGFILAIFGIYNILSLLKYSMKRKLWVILTISALSSVVAEITTTETDIIIAGIVISSIYLFWYGLKNRRVIPVFMSSLAYALAVGTKTTALIAVPGCAIGFIVLSIYYYGKREFYKPILKFIGFGILNFIIFSSYNYILNFIDYGNIFGSKYILAAHENPDGIRAIPANFIKYLFMFVDFAGFMWNEYLGEFIAHLRESVLSVMHLSAFKDGYFTLGGNRLTLVEPVMGMGVLGLILYFPFWIFSLFKPVCSKNKRSLFIFGFAMLLIINLVVMSYKIAYMSYSIRFLTSFCVISAPILVYSYCRRNNLYKFIVSMFAMYYLSLVSTHLYSRPFAKVTGYFKEGYTIQQIRNIGACSFFVFLDKLSPSDRVQYSNLCINEACRLRNYIKENIDKRNKILFFADTPERLLLIKMMDFEGYNIDYGSLEDIDNMDMSKYNLAIFINDKQSTVNIKQFDKRKFDISVKSHDEIYDRTNSGNYCIYERYPYEIVSATDNIGKVPFKATCYYTDKYLSDRFNFKYLTTYTVNLNFGKLPKDENIPYVWQYRFFENQLNPMIK